MAPWVKALPNRLDDLSWIPRTDFFKLSLGLHIKMWHMLPAPIKEIKTKKKLSV